MHAWCTRTEHLVMVSVSLVPILIGVGAYTACSIMAGYTCHHNQLKIRYTHAPGVFNQYVDMLLLMSFLLFNMSGAYGGCFYFV